jgi:hypothetical protein
MQHEASACQSARGFNITKGGITLGNSFAFAFFAGAAFAPTAFGFGAAFAPTFVGFGAARFCGSMISTSSLSSSVSCLSR